jgi:hypothetical protein
MIIVSYERLQKQLTKQDKDFLKDDANNLPKSISESINYRGEEFILDAMLMVNHNKKVGETIVAGITNENKKYIYFNVVGGQTKEQGIKNFECNNILPYDWFQEDTPFCIDGNACKILNQNQNKQYCFNKTIGTRIFIYVKKEIRKSLDKHKLERQDASNYSRSIPQSTSSRPQSTSRVESTSSRPQSTSRVESTSSRPQSTSRVESTSSRPQSTSRVESTSSSTKDTRHQSDYETYNNIGFEVLENNASTKDNPLFESESKSSFINKIKNKASSTGYAMKEKAKTFLR